VNLINLPAAIHDFRMCSLAQQDRKPVSTINRGKFHGRQDQVLRKTQIWQSTPTDRPQESRRNRSSLPRERGVNKRSLSERSERPGPVALQDSKLSVAGIKVFAPGGSLYSGTKFAVRAISEGLRVETRATSASQSFRLVLSTRSRRRGARTRRHRRT
jgi:hypothetical protein